MWNSYFQKKSIEISPISSLDYIKEREKRFKNEGVFQKEKKKKRKKKEKKIDKICYDMSCSDWKVNFELKFL